MVVTGTYNLYLVVLSILVASFASYTALDLGGRVEVAQGPPHRIWLAAAALTMGGGIWSMHFVAMLAFVLPMPMSYDVGLTVLSLVLAILAAGGGFYVISRPGVSRPRLVLSGVFMGFAISGMHYTGMAAMRGPVELTYDRLWVTLSVIIAIGAATAALWLAYRTPDPGQKLAAAIVMGLAISGMHYTGMRAAVFTDHATMEHAHEHTTLDQPPPGAGDRRFHARRSGRPVRLPVQAQAQREGPASDAGGSCPYPAGHRDGRAGGLDYPRGQSAARGHGQ
jgi:NO-binding membrane sensor protein with MHYT domain